MFETWYSIFVIYLAEIKFLSQNHIKKIIKKKQ